MELSAEVQLVGSLGYRDDAFWSRISDENQRLVCNWLSKNYYNGIFLNLKRVNKSMLMCNLCDYKENIDGFIRTERFIKKWILIRCNYFYLKIYRCLRKTLKNINKMLHVSLYTRDFLYNELRMCFMKNQFIKYVIYFLFEREYIYIYYRKFDSCFSCCVLFILSIFW